MPQQYRVTLSDGRKLLVTTEGGPPSEQDILGATSAPDKPTRGYVGTGPGGYGIVDNPSEYNAAQSKAHEENLPTYAAMGATALTGGGALPAMLAAGGGGMAGKAAQHGLRGESPLDLDVPLEGLKQAAFEGVGQAPGAIANPLYRLATRGGSKAAADVGLRKGLVVTAGNAQKLRDAITAATAAGRTPTVATSELAEGMTRATQGGGLDTVSLLSALGGLGLGGPAKGVAAGLAARAARSPAVQSGTALLAHRAAPLARGGPNVARVLEMLLSGEGGTP